MPSNCNWYLQVEGGLGQKKSVSYCNQFIVNELNLKRKRKKKRKSRTVLFCEYFFLFLVRNGGASVAECPPPPQKKNTIAEISPTPKLLWVCIEFDTVDMFCVRSSTVLVLVFSNKVIFAVFIHFDVFRLKKVSIL